jgi:RNA polymerase sigma-70 factor, ECF subfamily
MAEVEAIQGSGATAEAAEARLVRELRERPAEAAGELYARFAARLHRFAVTRLLGDVEAAEDIVVEAMAAAVRDIASFDPLRSTLTAWLFAITAQRVRLERRRRERLKSVPAWAQEPLEAAERVEVRTLDGAVAARLDARRRVALLEKALSGLELEVLILSHVEGLAAREVGQVVGRSERAVHSILHRARTKARDRLVNRDE